MPGCSAENCTNSSVKGFKMIYFPRDPHRRAKWIANLKRANWIPTDNSTLCEVHFTQDMWEKPRVDGKRKLKLTAIPTIFSHQVEYTHTSDIANKNLTAAIDTAAVSSIEETGDVYFEAGKAIIEDTIAECEKTQILKNSEASNGGEDERYKKLEKLWLKSERLRKQMQKKLQAAKKKIKHLEFEVRANKQCNAIYIAGYIIANIKKNKKTCKNCIRRTGLYVSPSFNYNKLTQLRRRAGCKLFFVNSKTFNFFVKMETIFRQYYENVRSNKNINLKKFFVNKYSNIEYSLPACHNLKIKLFYVIMRLD